jgi:hypothetical protein
MANCNDLFQQFLSEITISNNRIENLQQGRDAIRDKIANYFSKELKVKQPEFCQQGSYKLKTMVKPLNPADDYDLDDGIYLQHTDNDIKNPTPAEARNWIIDAVKNHTKKAPVNKKKCVRVIYEEGYHIDLPVYREINGVSYLGTLEGNQWMPSDAKAFNDWFYDRLEKTEQMRSCIKYLKAWEDLWGFDLKSIHITILVALNHAAVKERDDESVASTIANIVSYMGKKRAIFNPVDAGENLLSDWSDSQVDLVINALAKAHKQADSALNEADKVRAAQQWQHIFGTRFFTPSNNGGDDRGDRKKQSPVVITQNPSPWSPK